MLSTVKNCCRILWKHPTLNHHRRPQRMLLLGLCLLLCSAPIEADPIKSRRSQRRFMWANSMNGFMGSMASGARAMTNMFTDLMPTMQSTALPGLVHGNILDYLPSETTRIKYIIRSPPPNSKPVKIIKIHSPKKYIKIMAPMKSLAHEQKTLTKPSKMHFPNAEQMRKLEKQQELIAEGRKPAPPKDEFHAAPPYTPNYETYKQQQGGAEDSNIVSGKIHFGDGWKPVHDELIRQPNAYHQTIKSYPMSELHTNIATAELPKAEQLIYEHAAEHENDNDVEDLDDVNDANDADEDDFEDHDPLQQTIEGDEEETRHAQQYQPPSHTYEVTENTGEETVARPQTQEHPHAMRGLFPARGMQATNTLPSTSVTSTTEEPPNYPASFLRRQREQQRSTQSPPPQPLALARFKHREASMPAADSSWTPSTNISYSGFRARPTATPIQHHQHQIQHNHQQQHTKVRQKSEKWPPEMPPPRPFVAMAMTETAVAFEATTMSPPSGGRPTRKNVKFRATTAPATSGAAGRPTFRDINQRGSVKFGDKL